VMINFIVASAWSAAVPRLILAGRRL